MAAGRASRTAVLVCQGRAAAHGRIAVDRFDDPTALALLGDDERAAVERMRTGEPPKAWGERMEYEMLRANSEVMVPRTVGIDDAVRERPTPQVVILGAGLDGRAWRMAELAGVDVFEVDQPASQQDKRDRIGDLRPVARSLRFVPVDFTRDALGEALAAADHDGGSATTWIWEGVVAYLTPEQVETTLGIVAGRSAPGSRLIVNYQAPALSATLGRLVTRALTVATRRTDPLAHEPRRSAWTPASMRTLLTGHGFAVVRDDDLLTLADDLDLEVRNRRTVALGRIAVADR